MSSELKNEGERARLTGGRKLVKQRRVSRTGIASRAVWHRRLP